MTTDALRNITNPNRRIGYGHCRLSTSYVKRTARALTAICMHTSYVFAILMKEKSAENVQSYLSAIFAHKGGSIAICDNGIGFKNAVLTYACEQLGIKLYWNPFHPQGNFRIQNVYSFHKRTLNKFLDSSNLEWDELLPFACYCYNIFLGSNGTELPFTLFLAINQQKADICTSTIAADITETTGKIKLARFHNLWKNYAAYFKGIHYRKYGSKPCKPRNNTKFEIGQIKLLKHMHFMCLDLGTWWTTKY